MSARPQGNATGRWLMVAAVVAVAATVVAAVAVMDSPSRVRAERLDQRRVEHLQLLEDRIETHFDVHEALPAQLSVVAGPPGRTVADPATGQPYGYQVTGERSFRLCAVFEVPSDEAPPVPRSADEWRHAAGHQCFDREVPGR